MSKATHGQLGGFLAIFMVTLFLTGCPGDEEKIEAHDKAVAKARVEKLDQFRDKVRSSFLLGALGFVCISFFAPTIAEEGRKFAAKQFSLSDETQVKIAVRTYWAVVSSVALFSLLDKSLSTVFPAIFLLLGATAYPFFVHILPSIPAHDKMRRKAAMAQMKSFVMLIFIFYIILRFLSPDGFGDIQLK